MKMKKISCFLFAVLLGAVIMSLSAGTAFAESEIMEEPEIVEPQTNPEYTEPVYTEPEYTEPVYTEPQTETEPEPQTEPEIQTEAPTEYVAPETEYNGGGLIENFTYSQQPTEFFEPPTLPKTISKKTYSTNYTAGIVSWICVGIGVIVVAAVLISTKVSGRGRTGRI
ncbi:MAG: hypothetical protein UFA98_04055 [Ruminococcus sp.]|nr:hypothetical protein [Ruminococcus sp.]